MPVQVSKLRALAEQAEARTDAQPAPEPATFDPPHLEDLRRDAARALGAYGASLLALADAIDGERTSVPFITE